MVWHHHHTVNPKRVLIVGERQMIFKQRPNFGTWESKKLAVRTAGGDVIGETGKLGDIISSHAIDLSISLPASGMSKSGLAPFAPFAKTLAKGGLGLRKMVPGTLSGTP